MAKKKDDGVRMTSNSDAKSADAASGTLKRKPALEPDRSSIKALPIIKKKRPA